jgi:hypothetical protein
MEGGLMASPTDSSLNLNLEQQRKRAKDLHRDHGSGALEAAVRIARYLPRARDVAVEQVLASPLKLVEAQFVVAREAGFLSWPKMKRNIDAASASPVDIVEGLIDAAFAGNDDEVRRLLDRDPEATRRSIYAAAAVGCRCNVPITSSGSVAGGSTRRKARLDSTPLPVLQPISSW